MTRSFGWSLASTSLIPIADLLNHHVHTATHYMMHLGMEKNQENKHKNYKIIF